MNLDLSVPLCLWGTLQRDFPYLLPIHWLDQNNSSPSLMILICKMGQWSSSWTVPRVFWPSLSHGGSSPELSALTHGRQKWKYKTFGFLADYFSATAVISFIGGCLLIHFFSWNEVISKEIQYSTRHRLEYLWLLRLHVAIGSSSFKALFLRPKDT